MPKFLDPILDLIKKREYHVRLLGSEPIVEERPVFTSLTDIKKWFEYRSFWCRLLTGPVSGAEPKIHQSVNLTIQHESGPLAACKLRRMYAAPSSKFLLPAPMMAMLPESATERPKPSYAAPSEAVSLPC